MRELEPLQDDNDEQIGLAIEQLSALVGPILKEMFQRSAEGKDYWLKQASLQHLTRWIQSTQDIADVMQQTIEQMQHVIGAQEAELKELRPVQKKVWTPTF